MSRRSPKFDPSHRVLVVGGTGRAGRAAVQQLIRAGATVRILARRAVPAIDGAEMLQGDVSDASMLQRAVEGCQGIHIALAGGPTRASYRAVEVEGTAGVVAAARRSGVGFLSFMSGSTTCEENGWYHATRAKLDGEELVNGSGLPHLVLRSSWLMESLPAFVKGGRASLVGRLLQPYRWVAARDVGAAVAEAHRTGRGGSPTLYAYGPEPITLRDALQRYVDAVEPTAKMSPVPTALLWIVGAMSGTPGLRDLAGRMRYFEKAGPEPSDVPTIPAPTSLSSYLAGLASPGK
jgi:uncharacterized protein YbjT (DUF2867 family)